MCRLEYDATGQWETEVTVNVDHFKCNNPDFWTFRVWVNGCPKFMRGCVGLGRDIVQQDNTSVLLTLRDLIAGVQVELDVVKYDELAELRVGIRTGNSMRYISPGLVFWIHPHIMSR